MYSKILILRFPRTEVRKPIVCNLTKQFNLTFNILNATILPRKEGVMVLELEGTQKDFKAGVRYLKKQKVNVQNVSNEVRRSKEKCIHCGACTAVCPTSALYIERPSMTVVFDEKKCSRCELCVPLCPTRSMTINPITQTFF